MGLGQRLGSWAVLLAVFEFAHTTIELEFADETCRDQNSVDDV